MIINNLSVLLAQRNLKITRVSNDTGISRSTLTNLSQNSGKGIQYDTLNTLLGYLKATPNDFFSYIPFDCEYTFDDTFVSKEENVPIYYGEATLFLNFTKYGEKYTTIEYEADSELIDMGSNRISYSALFTPVEDEDLSIFEEIPVQFQMMMKNEITDFVINEISSKKTTPSVEAESDITIYLNGLPF